MRPPVGPERTFVAVRSSIFVAMGTSTANGKHLIGPWANMLVGTTQHSEDGISYYYHRHIQASFLAVNFAFVLNMTSSLSASIISSWTSAQ
jgi:hypothetical protein